MARLTRTIAASALALGTAAAVAGPAQAHSGPGAHHWAHHHGEHRASGFDLTPSAAETLSANNVDVRVVPGRSSRYPSTGVVSLDRGAVVFDGAARTTWARLHVNERTNRVTAVVNGDREAVLRFRGHCDGGSARFGHHHRGASVLRLTRDGAASVDHAAGKDIFEAGDAFAVAR